LTPLIGEIPENVTGWRSVDLVWTLDDSRRARREGWDICIDSDRGLEINGYEWDMSQMMALAHCREMAGISTLHAKALAIHFYNLATREQ